VTEIKYSLAMARVHSPIAAALPVPAGIAINCQMLIVYALNEYAGGAKWRIMSSTIRLLHHGPAAHQHCAGSWKDNG
jgi:hypothetical protein